jgi:general secretion pathway protein A
MYHAFYGLTENPFDLTSDLKFLLLTPKHQEALAHLEYGTSAGTGITLLIGEAGTGKTTLLRRVLASKHPLAQARFVLLTNPALNRREFYDCLADGFRLSSTAARSKAVFLRELERALIREIEHRGASEIPRVLVIDEAQSLSDELLEEVRLLANIELETQKLLRVVLAGQPALADRLNQPGSRQLKQRVGLRCRLDPLDLNETATYIAHRISIAGGTPGNAFSREAVVAIHEQSGGVPRTINVICENALLTGYAAGHRPVGLKIVSEVCGDLDLPFRQESLVRSGMKVEAMPRRTMFWPPDSGDGQSVDDRHARSGGRFSSFPYLRRGRR